MLIPPRPPPAGPFIHPPKTPYMRITTDPEARLLYWHGLWLTIGWLLVVAVILLSLIKSPVSLPYPQGDKSGHLLAYGVLMFWFAQVYAKRANRLGIALALLLLGCTLEIVQLTVDRYFEYADMLANAVGILLGWLVSPPRSPHLLSKVEACLLRKAR